MYTSDNRLTEAYLLRTSFIYLIAAAFLAFFGAVYEYFSFGVYSYYMICGQAAQLIRGAHGIQEAG